MRNALLSLLVILAACSGATEPSDPAAALAQSRTRWYNAGITDYEFTITRVCECLAESTGPVVVEVRNGVIEERRYAGGSPVDPQYADLFTAVPGLFDLVEEAIQREAAGLAVRYNDTYGYPESIQIDWVAGAVDDEVSYRITGFTLLSRR